MKVVELLGALREDQNFRIYSADARPEVIDVTTAARNDAKVLAVSAIDKGWIRIDTNFRWCRK
jgi:hypothetical protein